MGRQFGVAAFLLFLALGTARADEEVRERRRAIEDEFAPRYMDIAEAAKKHRGAELARAAFSRAEELAPGNDRVILFDPEVDGRPRSYQRRRLAALEDDFRETRTAEARARFDLAVWCDDEAWIDEAVEEAVAALRLAPGPVSFDVEGVLSEPGLGELPPALSLAVLEEYEVYEGRLVPVAELPESISWERGWTIATDHYDIRTNVSGRIGRLVGRALEAAREIYAEVTGFNVEPRITVWIVATRAQYESLWEKLGEGVPDESNIGKCVRDFCGVDGSRSDREVVAVAIHEVAHGYLNLGIEALTGTRGATMPPWFHEGFATYCAGYGPGSLSYDRGVVLPRIARAKPLSRFREELLAGETIPLEEFLAAEHGDGRFYRQAMAFFWFFDEMEDAELRRAWERAVAAMERAALGEDRIERGNAIFIEKLDVPLAEVEARFHAWAKALDLQE